MTRTDDRKSYLRKKKEMGQVPKALLEEAKTQTRLKAAILSALKAGPLTIPAIGKAAGIDSKTAVYYVMTLRRYGQIRDAGSDGDYYTYALKEG